MRCQTHCLVEPVYECCLHLGELGFGAGGDALKEVVGAFYDCALFGLGSYFQEAVQDVLRAKFVVVAGEEELGGGAVGEEGVGVVAACGADGQSQADEGGDAGVAAAGAETDVRAEGEAGEEGGFVGEDLQVSHGGANVFDLSATFVVRAF